MPAKDEQNRPSGPLTENFTLFFAERDIFSLADNGAFKPALALFAEIIFAICSGDFLRFLCAPDINLSTYVFNLVYARLTLHV
jgi:hypothetical protein